MSSQAGLLGFPKYIEPPLPSIPNERLLLSLADSIVVVSQHTVYIQDCSTVGGISST